MGPQWFFEGFAVVGAGQGFDRGLRFTTAAEALDAARDSKSPLAYRRYAAAVRYFGQKVPLPALVERARDPELEAWLSTLSSAPHQ
jgi:hypothetical protein